MNSPFAAAEELAWRWRGAATLPAVGKERVDKNRNKHGVATHADLSAEALGSSIDQGTPQEKNSVRTRHDLLGTQICALALAPIGQPITLILIVRRLARLALFALGGTLPSALNETVQSMASGMLLEDSSFGTNSQS